MYKNILYYSKNKNNSVYSQLFNIASKYKLKLLLASNATSFFSKYKNSGVIIFNKSEIKEVIRLVSLMEKNSAFYCQIEDVDQVINNYKEMCRLLSQTKANISAFLDNINLPPIYTANIIIKHALFFLNKNDNTICSYNLLKKICVHLHLEWEKEKITLRRILKAWYKYKEKYTSENFNFSILATVKEINKLFNAYSFNTKEHSIYNLKTNINNLLRKDYAFMQNAFKNSNE